MNWGVRILVILTTIVVGTVSMGIYMVSKDTDTLDEQGYYEKGLDYETIIEHKRNVARDHAEPSITLKASYLEFQFNEGNHQGEIQLKRASNELLDQSIPFNTTNQPFTLSLKDIKSGAWEVQVTWVGNEVPYYYEKRLYIP